MAAQLIHYAKIQSMPVNEAGIVISKDSASINAMMRATAEPRIVVDSAIPNSTGNPSVETYLKAEAAAGYVVQHLSIAVCITYKQPFA